MQRKSTSPAKRSVNLATGFSDESLVWLAGAGHAERLFRETAIGSSGSTTSQAAYLASPLLEAWRSMLLLHRYQIEPLILTLCALLRRIDAARVGAGDGISRLEHARRIRSQISSIERNFILAFALFEKGDMADELRRLVESHSLLVDYAAGLDVAEHILRAIGTNTQQLAATLGMDTVPPLNSLAFCEAPP